MKVNAQALAIISGRQSISVELRMQALGVKHIYQNQPDKLKAFNVLKNKLKLTNNQIAHMGDDLTDLPIFNQVGLSIAVADSDEFTKKHANYITKKSGGNGAVREACELIMQAQNTLADMRARYLIIP